MNHNHYFRDIPKGVNKMDIYRFLELFGVTCPVAQHVIKKAVAAGQRGHKDIRRDWMDVQDSAARKLEMMDEEESIATVALNGESLADPHWLQIVQDEDSLCASAKNPNKL